jgi:hypothetical protein
MGWRRGEGGLGWVGEMAGIRSGSSSKRRCRGRWFACVRGSSTPPFSGKHSTVGAGQLSRRPARKADEVDHSTQQHRLPLMVIGGHASTDAPDGSSSEHLLPRRATAACVRARACCSTAHATGDAGIIESAMRHTPACMRACMHEEQHIQTTTIARYSVYSRAGPVLDGVSAHVPP